MGEAVVFFVTAGTVFLITNERIKKQKSLETDKFDPLFGRFQHNASRNNLNNFIRRPNEETKLLVSDNTGLFGDEYKEKNNEMKLKAKILNPFWMMNPFSTRSEDRKAGVQYRMHGSESDQINVQYWMRRG